MQILNRQQMSKIDFTDTQVLLQIFWKTLQSKRNGRAVNAQEIAMIPEMLTKGAFYSLPGYLLDDQLVGLKWTSHVPKTNEPFTEPLILLNSMQSGMPLALVDGLRIGGVRTALVTLLALQKLLSVVPIRILICGSGFQAQQHLDVLYHSLPNTHFLIWDREQSHAQRVAAQYTRRVSVVNDLKYACQSSTRVIIGATSAMEPYLHYEWLSPRQLYVHIGLHDMAPDDVAHFNKIICDDYRAGQLTSQQSLFIAMRQGLIVSKQVQLLEDISVPLDTSSDNKPLMFDQFGLQIFDFVLAKYALTKFERKFENANISISN
ncbi:hypothetical protein [Liquorilactobacillus ghanensis]|nr:hypothetical protein [Liquorilactobacillus ghanensis]